MTTRILGLSGGLRKASTNTALVRVAQQQASEGVEIELYDGVGSLPLFNGDLESEPPAAVVELREKIAAADGVLIATPEYSCSIPGACSTPWRRRSSPSPRCI